MGHQTGDQQLHGKPEFSGTMYSEKQQPVKGRITGTSQCCHQCFYVEAAAQSCWEELTLFKGQQWVKLNVWLHFGNMYKWKENVEQNDNALSFSQL